MNNNAILYDAAGLVGVEPRDLSILRSYVRTLHMAEDTYGIFLIANYSDPAPLYHVFQYLEHGCAPLCPLDWVNTYNCYSDAVLEAEELFITKC